LTYDDAGRLASTTNALNETVTQEYDSAGNRTGLINARGKTYQFAFTANNLTESLTTPLSRVFGYTHDDRLFLHTFVEPSTQTVTYTYYSDGQLQQTVDPTGTIDFAHDSKGRLQTVTEGSNTLTRAYDALDRVISFEDSQGNVVGYNYDGGGHLTDLIYPDSKGSVVYAYDNAGRLATVTDWASRVTQFFYDSNSRLEAIVYPNGTEREFSYDAAGRISRQADTHISNQTVLLDQHYSYDALGRVSEENVSPEPASYVIAPALMAYDDDDRISSWQSGTADISPAFDVDGNMTSGPLGGVPETFVYDSRNRLIQAGTATYTYDAEDRRISKTEGGETTTFVHDPHASLSRLLQKTTGGVTTYYVYAAGQLLYEETAGQITVYHVDMRGSTLAMSDASGTVTSRITYGTYGEVVATTGTLTTPFLYNGAYGVQTDVNGLLHMRARYYSPELRRFVNADPIRFAGGMNWYGYAGGNPVMGTDPTGHVVETAWDVANIGLGVYSFHGNIREGNWGWAALDGLGLLYDGAAVAVPFLPAGVSAGLKARRVGNSVVQSANAGVDIARVTEQTHQTAKTFDAVSTVPWQAAIDGRQIHRQVAGHTGDSLRYFDSTFMSGGANRYTGIQPDMIGRGLWGDITTQGQWRSHVSRYGGFGEGIPILYERGVGVVNYQRLLSGAGVTNSLIK
jgi:RHS repeat-associated protein